MRDQSLVKGMLNSLFYLLDNRLMVAVEIVHPVQRLLNTLLVLLNLTTEVADTRTVGIEVGGHTDHVNLGESVQG